MKKTHAIILSNSCDAARRQNIILAPLFSFEESEQDDNSKVDFRKNNKFSVLYFPDTNLKDYYINFDYIYNLNLDLLNSLIQEGKVQKLFDLTNPGYYLLITKLTIFFARPESIDIQRENNIN